MACNQQILGYSNVSSSQACRNYYINPTTLSLDGLLSDNSNSILNKIIYQDSSCSVQSPTGYYSDGFVVRYYTTNNLGVSENCGKTNLFRYCCDGRLFRFNNIEDFYPGGLPQGLSLYLSVSNGINQFNGCFESVFDDGQPIIYDIVEFLGGLYTNCQSCLNVNKPTCLLTGGTYEFKSCISDTIKYFDITTDYLFYPGSVVVYDDICYSLISGTTETPEFSFSSITYSSCTNTNCLPLPSPTPVVSNIVKSCCNDTLYKLSSGIDRPIGSVYSLPPSDFCYIVVPVKSSLPSNIQTLNDTNFILVDNCNSVGCQKCPDVQLTGQTANECEPITIFPLGLTCNVVDPTIENPFGGILSVIITGGTSPYIVVWNPGGTGTTIFNQPSGTYVATVTDYYNDFRESITCTLSGPVVCDFEGSITSFIPPTPTPTPTPTGTPIPTPTPTGVPGCVEYQIINPYSSVSFPITYLDCYNENQTYVVSGSETYQFCAIQGTVVSSVSPIELGVCIPPTPTPTPTPTPSPTPSLCTKISLTNTNEYPVTVGLKTCTSGIPSGVITLHSLNPSTPTLFCVGFVQTPLPTGVTIVSGTTC